MVELRGIELRSLLLLHWIRFGISGHGPCYPKNDSAAERRQPVGRVSTTELGQRRRLTCQSASLLEGLSGGRAVFGHHAVTRRNKA
jgi:hypothetical protein